MQRSGPSRRQTQGRGKRCHGPPRSVPPPGGYRLLVLVGIPGSGKSSFSSVLSDLGWTIVNQDTLGSRKKCEGIAQEVLKKGGRVIIDRCNFDQSQRVTWTNLAAALSLHKDACVAVWLDAPTATCQARVQNRVGHPTLGAVPASSSVVSRFARKLRPPQRKEGFHDILRCKNDQDLSEAVALLSPSATAFLGAVMDDCGSAAPALNHDLSSHAVPGTRRKNSSFFSGGVAKPGMTRDYPLVAVPFVAEEGLRYNNGPSELIRPSSDFCTVATSRASSDPLLSSYPGYHNAVVDYDFGVAAVTVAAAEVAAALTSGFEKSYPSITPRWGGEEPPSRAGGYGGSAINSSGQAVARMRGAIMATGASHNSKQFPSLPTAINSRHRTAPKTAYKHVATIKSDNRTHFRTLQQNSIYAAGLDAGVGAAGAQSIVERPPQPLSTLSSSSSTTVPLTPAEISASFPGSAQSPPSLETPKPIDGPQGLGSTLSDGSWTCFSGTSVPASSVRSDLDLHIKRPTVAAVPLDGPTSLEEWSCQIENSSPMRNNGGDKIINPFVDTDYTGALSRRVNSNSALEEIMGEKHLLNRKEEAPAGSRGCHVETTATLLTSEYGYFLSADQMEADAVGAALAGGVDWEEGTKGSDYGGAMDPDYPKTGESFEGGVEPGLDLSEGEAFFVLEDMFGGLLPPSVLERVFVESGQDLEEAVKQGFQEYDDLWGREEVAGEESEPPLSGSSCSDTLTSARAYLPSTSSITADGTGMSSSTSSGNINRFDVAWDESDEFADVSEWTHEQVDALTELCLAFEGTARERVVAALAASNHDPSSAAQLLLETSDSRHTGDARDTINSSSSNSCRRQTQKVRASSRGNGKQSRARHTRRFENMRAQPRQQQAGLIGRPAASSLPGSTCGFKAAAVAVTHISSRDGKEGEEFLCEEGGAGEEEEEQDDERLTSEEYRARANEAAEDMKHWFKKAAEAFKRSGRNGGAVAVYPAEVGQRCKKKMETTNRRAAREAFREKNPLFRVGHTHGNTAVLKVLALPKPSQCSPRGALSIDLHFLRKDEALKVVEAVLHAIRLRRFGDPVLSLQSRGVSQNRHSISIANHIYLSSDISGVAPGGGFGALATDEVGEKEIGFRAKEGCPVRESFLSLSVVVGRGAHSRQGVARLKPAVVGYLSGRGFKSEPGRGLKGEGVVVVSLV